jgi:filamentous hemagglutinin family protein
VLAAILACGLLIASAAGAEPYRVLWGSLVDAETGSVAELTGAFAASLSEPQPIAETLRSVLHVEGFELVSGGRTFLPRGPIAYDGRTASFFLEPANHISLHDDGRVGFFFLRSGGDIVAESEEEVTFRFLEFRSGGGRTVGRVGDPGVPRRLELHGTLYELDQRFAILDEGDCTLLPAPTPPTPPGGGGIQIDGGGYLTPDWDSFDIDPDEAVEFVPPSGGGGVINRVTGGDGSTIGGSIVGEGRVVVANPLPVVLDPVASATAPTLEELGIVAPSGAVVTYSEFGALTVTTEGDLILHDVTIDLPGLTSVRLVAGGSITITGSFSTPPMTAVFLETTELPDPDVIVVPRPFCRGLRPIFERVEPGGALTAGRALGTFSLVATAALPVAIDVRPGSAMNRVMPGFRLPVPVAILGAEDFDVRAVDPRSLRFGPDEAGPGRRLRRAAVLRRDVNRDGLLDLLAWFNTQEAGIAYGETRACLLGELNDGTAFEGCDAIDTRPASRRRQLGDRLRRP